MKTKTIYYIREDGIYSNIESRVTDADFKCDNSYCYFDKFKDAKKCLLNTFKSKIQDIKYAVAGLKMQKESDVEAIECEE